MDVFYLTSFVCRPPKKFPTVGTSDSCPMWLTLMTMFPINPDFPCTPSTIAALGSLPFGRPFCCGWVSWKEKMTDETSLERNSRPSTSPGYSWIWSALCFFLFFSGIMGNGGYHQFSSARQSWFTSAWWSHGAPVAATILPPGVGRPNMLRFKMILVKQQKSEEKLHGSVILQKKESAETGKARTWKRAGGSTKTTCSLFAQKQSFIIDTQKWRKTYCIYNNHIIPITLSYLICRHSWHMIHAYQQQNRYRASPWTSGRQNYGAMLPALWKNWTWPSSSWETSGQPAGEPAGKRKGVENGFWGLKPYRLMCLGWYFCDWRFQHVFFWFPWRLCGLKRMSFTFPGSFAQFERMTSGLLQAQLRSSAAAKEDLLTVLGIDTGPQVTVEEHGSIF